MTTTTHPEALRQTPGWWHRLTWLPVPLFLAAIAILFFLDPGRSYERPHLLMALIFVCSGLPAAFVAYLCARSYLAQGAPGLLLLGCGVLLWGTAGMVGVVAGLIETPGPDAANVAITIHNSSVWLSAVCQLAGAVLLLYPRRAMRTPGLWLSAACAIILGLVGLLTLAALGQWTPTFFVPGRGGTPLRQFVLGSGTAIFVLSSVLLWQTGRGIASSFAYWFSLALALIALGLLAVMGQSVQGGILGWTGRAAQFLGSAYMLVAALVSARESRVWGIPLAEALSAAQEQYRALVEMSPDAIVVHADGKWVFANSAALRLFGATREEEILGREALDLVHIDDREAAAGHILLLDQRGQATSSRAFKARRLDGRLLDVESSASRIEFQGRPAVLVVLHDITERRQAEEALRKSEVRLRRFYESPLLGVIYWNMAGHITDANDKFLDMVGYTREDLTTGRINWAPLTPPEFRHLDEASVKELKATGVNQQPFEKEYLRKDGSRLPILVAGAMLDEARFNGVAFVLDIAVRKQAEAALRESEAKYRNLFENMTEEVHFWQLVRDELGRIKTWRLVDANPPTLKTWGRTLDGIKGRTTDEIFGQGATEHYMPVVQKIMADGVPHVFEDYFPNLGKHFRFTSVPLGDYFITTGADITQHKRAEDELREFSAELQAANVSLGESRRAALNLMEDAIAARQRAERVSAELRQEVAERQRAEEEIRSLARFPAENPNPVLRLDAEGRILFANEISAFLLEQWGAAVGSQAPAPWPDTVREALTSRSGTTVELGCGERTYAVFVTPIADAGYVNLYSTDITERKWAEQERETTVELLRLVNESKNLRELVRTAVAFFCQQSGCEAVGVRLREGEDYPYYQTHGFPETFVLLENHLCARDAADQVLRDSAGYPIIECMCGNVICGRFDPVKPFFTAKGSFWTNNTTELLATSTEAERQTRTRTRNRCNGEGYESVALIALRVGEERLGLLQLNDKRAGMFSARTIALWERLADYLAVALAKLRADEALREGRQDLNRAQAVARTGSWRLNVQRNELTWSDENWRIFGVPRGTPLTYETFLGTIHPEDRDYVHEKWSAALGGAPYDIEHRIVVGGTVKWVRERAELEFDREGKLLGGFGTTQDITERKEAQERITASLREKEVLLKEIHHRVKNNLQVISSLVRLQADALADPALRDLFRDVHDRVRSMALVHEKLYESANLAEVQFADYAQSLLAYLWRAHGAAAARIRLTLELDPVALSVETAVPCGLILNELAGNALKHAFAGRTEGEVTVALRNGAAGRVSLAVGDNGVGLPPGTDWRQSRSLGLRLVQMLAGQLNATVEARGGDGTVFEISFTPPVAHGGADGRALNPGKEVHE